MARSPTCHQDLILWKLEAGLVLEGAVKEALRGTCPHMAQASLDMAEEPANTPQLVQTHRLRWYGPFVPLPLPSSRWHPSAAG